MSYRFFLFVKLCASLCNFVKQFLVLLILKHLLMPLTSGINYPDHGW
jgi:hypothetical protein